MDEGTLDRARQRLADAAEGRPDAAALEATLERARAQLEALAQTAAELETSVPERVGEAVRTGLQSEVLPVGRHLAEVRGLAAQSIRRLERLEGDLLSERHARVDDLALLVDLVTAAWNSVDRRLERLENGLRTNGIATVYRIADDAGEPSARGDDARRVAERAG